MLAVVQLPFTDARAFIEGETKQLPWPNWKTPRANKEYVRSFGLVRERTQGGVPDWSAEENFSDASRAIRFSAKGLRVPLGDEKQQIIYPYCAFRRFMVDARFPGLKVDGESISAASVVSRLEIGFGFRRKKPFDLFLNVPAALAIVEALTKVNVCVRRQSAAQALFDAGPQLAALYLAASTRRKKKFLFWKKSVPLPTEPWWLGVGTPLLLIKYTKGDFHELPEHSRRITAINQPGLDLHYCRTECHGIRFGVWFLGVDLDQAKGEHGERLRRLRISLLRLHSERESIKQILRLIASERISISRGTRSSDRLQQYLDQSITLLSKQRSSGLPQSDILEAAQGYEELVTPGEKESLITQLGSIRKTLLQRIDKITEPSSERDGKSYNIYNGAVIIFEEQNGSKTVTTQNINFGKGNIITDVNVMAARTIQDSANRVSAANVNQELRDALQELHKAVAEMSKKLPEEKQKEVAKDLETLSSEAISQAPRKKWYELSSEGLLEAAKTIGEMAAPVITTVKAVLALLA